VFGNGALTAIGGFALVAGEGLAVFLLFAAGG
jgi:hypothetical protein